MSEGRVRFVDLRPREEAHALEEAIRRVIERAWFVLGPEVEAFEAEFAAACGARHAVGVGSGTDAIALVLKALGVGPGDEVITTPLSAAYTALAVMMAGARPVFADLDPDRLALDPRAAEAAIGPRTAALLPVHLYGQPAEIGAFAAMARRHGLALIEDCCQAHLATAGGRPVGSFGIAGAYSFYPTKNLGAFGDGGAVTTDDTQLAERVKRIRNGGQRDRYHHLEPGHNSRLDEIQAAILRARLPHLRAWTDRRRAIAAIYRRALSGAPIALPPELDAGHVYHLFPVRSAHRDRLRSFLADAGIETIIHYPVPIPRQPALAGERPAPCPTADAVCAEIVSLPIYPALGDADAARVAAAIRRFTPA